MKLHHCGDDMNKAHELTRAMRWNDYRVCNSLSTTQVWKWHGGDAIVVVANDHYGRLTGYSVVRMGKKVQVFEGAIKPVLEALGKKNISIVHPEMV